MANNVAALKAEAWSSVMQEVLREAFVGKFISNTKFEGLFNGNDTVHFPHLTPIVSQDLTTSYTNVTVQDLVTADETFVLDTRKHFAFEISNEDMIEMAISPESQAIQDGAHAFANDYDNSIMAEYANAGIVMDGTDIGGSAGDISFDKDNAYETIVTINQKLDEANVPGEGRFLVVDPKRKAQMLQMPELLRSTEMGDRTVTGGIVGTIDNTTIYYSNNLVTETGTTHLLAGQGKPVSFAANIKPKVEITTSDYRNSFAALVKAQTKFGVKTFADGARKLVDVPVVA